MVFITSIQQTLLINLVSSAIWNTFARSNTDRIETQQSSASPSHPIGTIARTDKGRGVVIMDRSDYGCMMETILQDPSTFTPIDHDLTIVHKNRLTRTLWRLKNERFITQADYDLVKPVGCGRGKLLTNRWSHLCSSPYVIKDSFDFIRKVQQSPHADKMMVSFDVTGLFTNVPLAFSIDHILDRMYPISSTRCNKLREQMDRSLRAATSEIHLLFDKKNWLPAQRCSHGWFTRSRCCWCLDWTHKQRVDTLNIVSNTHPSIKFTYEVEANRSPSSDIQDNHLQEANVYWIDEKCDINANADAVEVSRALAFQIGARKDGLLAWGESRFPLFWQQYHISMPLLYKRARRCLSVCATSISSKSSPSISSHVLRMNRSLV